MGFRHLCPTVPKIILESIQWPWNSPKTNSLHCRLSVVSILQNPVHFPVLQFLISLHYIQKQATTINSIHTHTFPQTILLCAHTKQISLQYTTSLDSWSHTSYPTRTASPPTLCQFPIKVHCKTCIYLLDTLEQCLSNGLFCTSYKTLYLRQDQQTMSKTKVEKLRCYKGDFTCRPWPVLYHTFSSKLPMEINISHLPANIPHWTLVSKSYYVIQFDNESDHINHCT